MSMFERWTLAMRSRSIVSRSHHDSSSDGADAAVAAQGEDSVATLRRSHAIARSLVLAAIVASIGFAATTSFTSASVGAPAYDPVPLANPLPFVSAKNPAAAVAGDFSVGADGAARYSIPLEAIPGPAGMAPALSLEYNSRSGNGYFGVGFSLTGVGAITRCPKNLADDGIVEGVKLDSTDPFCLGGLRLVAIKGEYGGNGTEYRTNPQTFAKIVSYRGTGTANDGPEHFEVRTRDGLIHLYGYGDQDTVGPRRVGWPIVSTRDRQGNRLRYAYTKNSIPSFDPVNLPGEMTSIRKLERINYGNFGAGYDSGWSDRRIVFSYQDRADDIHAYAYGAPRPVYERVWKIEMQRWAGNAHGNYVNARSYELNYKNDGATGLSKLDTIQQCGLSAAECLPKTSFQWQKGTAGFQSASQTGLLTPRYLSPILVLDTDGDGRDDLAYSHDDDQSTPEGRQWRVFRTGSNAPYPWNMMYVTPHGTNAAITYAFAIDYDLDGRTDILPRDADPYGIDNDTWRPLLTRGGDGNPLKLTQVKTGFTGPLNDIYAKAEFADFDGDGHQDLLERHHELTQQKAYWTVRFRTGKVSPSIKPEVLPETATDIEAFGPAHTVYSLGDLPKERVLVLDIDGDGRSELVYRTSLVQNDQLSAIGLVNRDASGASPAEVFNQIGLPGWLLNAGVQLTFADVNGDGLTDLVTNVRDPGQIGEHLGAPSFKVWVWHGTGRGFWAVPQPGVNINLQFDLAKAVVVDYDGDGRHDLLVPSPKTLPITPSTKWDVHLLRSNGYSFAPQLWLGMDFSVPVINTQSGYIAHPDYFATQGPQVIDADGDGQDDLVLVQRKADNSPGGPDDGFLFFRHRSAATPPDLLTGVQQGLNAAPATLAIEYRSLAGNPGFYTRGTCDRQFSSCGLSAYYAVSLVSRDAGLLGSAEDATVVSQYFYKNSITDKQTRRWLGFAEQIVISYPSDGSQPPVTTRRFYSNQDARRDPRLTEEWTYGSDGDRQWLERRLQQWQNKDQVVGQGANGKTLYFDYVSAHSTWSYEFPSGTLPFDLLYLDIVTPTVFDSNPIVNTSQYRHRQVLHNQILEMDDYGNVKRNRSFVGAGSFTTDIRTDYYPADVDKWLITRPRQIKTQRFLPPGCHEVSTCTETRIVEILGYAMNASGEQTLLPQTVRSDADDPLQKTETTYTYDGYGNVIRVSVSGDVDGEGAIATRNAYVTYDPDGVFPHALGNGLGHTTRMLHDPLLGVQRVLIDAKGLRTDLQYDTLGRPVKTRTPTGVETVVAYSVEDFGGSKLPRIETSDASGARSERVFDRLGRPVADRFKGFDGKMRVSTRAYDALGTLNSEDALPTVAGSAAPPQLRYTYDSRGRRLTQSEPNTADPAAPHLRTWSYDKRTVTYTDTRGNKTVREYGMAGGLGRVTEAAGTAQQITREYWQDMGQRPARSYVLGREAETANEFGWDRLGRMISRKDPDRGLTTYTYNAFGDLLLSTDANGRATRNRYDALGRMTQSATTQTIGEVTKLLAQTDYVYDIEMATQDKQPGRMTRMSRQDYVSASADGDEQQTKVEYDYDAFGRLGSEFHTLPSETNPAVEEHYTVGYGYDALDRLSQVVYPKLPGQSQPVRVQYAYAAASSGGNGQLRAIDSLDNGALKNIWLLTSTDEANRPMWTQTGDGVAKRRTYDWRGALSGQYLQTSNADSCAFCPLAESGYTYDGEGNLDSRTDLQQGATERFEYDPLNRLKSSEVDEAPNARQDWNYDTLGNVTRNTYRGTYQYGDPARPMRVTALSGGTIGTLRTYGYDAVGNQTVRPGENIVYNEMNLPARSQRPNGAVLASFLYGAGGERVRKTSTAGTTTYVKGIYERQRKATETEHRLIVPGIAELPYKETNGIAVRQPERYVHGDHLGSTIAVVADDDPGAGLKAKVKEVRSYDAFGLTRNPDWKSGSYASVQAAMVGQGYTGHNDDPELGLIDMKGRIYDPKLGRFLTADPFVSDPAATQPWHPYAYVDNNPLRDTDPSGYLKCQAMRVSGHGTWVCATGGGDGGGDRRYIDIRTGDNVVDINYSGGNGNPNEGPGGHPASGKELEQGFAEEPPTSSGLSKGIAKSGTQVALIPSSSRSDAPPVYGITDENGNYWPCGGICGQEQTIIAVALNPWDLMWCKGVCSNQQYLEGRLWADDMSAAIGYGVLDVIEKLYEILSGRIGQPGTMMVRAGSTKVGVGRQISLPTRNGLSSQMSRKHAMGVMEIDGTVVSKVRTTPTNGGPPINHGPIDLGPTIARAQAGRSTGIGNDGKPFAGVGMPNGATYREWDVPTPGGTGRGGMRILTGSDGSVWFSPDHYQSAVQVR